MRVVRRIGERDLSGRRKLSAVDQLDFDGKAVAGRQYEQAFFDFVANAPHLIFGDAEVDPHRRQNRHRRELRILWIDIRAVGDGCIAADAGDRRRNRRIGKIEVRFLELRLRLFDRGCSLIVLTLSVVEILLRERLRLGKRLGAVEICLGDSKGRLISLHSRLCRVDLRLERLLVHLKQHLARLHHRSFGVHTFVEKPGHPRLYVHSLRALRLRDVFGGDRDVLDFDSEDGHLGGWPWRRSLVLFAASGYEDERDCQRADRRRPARCGHEAQ